MKIVGEDGARRRRRAGVHVRARLAPDAEEVLRRGPCTASTGPAIKAAYARFLPYVDNNRDFAELISEMQGELNASHTGGRYRPTRARRRRDGGARASSPIPPTPATASRSSRSSTAGPLQQAGTKIRARRRHHGDRRRRRSPRASNWYPLLNHKAGDRRCGSPCSTRRARAPLGGGGQADLLERPGAAPLPALGRARAATRSSACRAAVSATPTSAA